MKHRYQKLCSGSLKRSGKENVTHKPAIEEEHLQQLKASGVFFRFLPHSRCWEMCGFILFFSFAEEAMKDKELNRQKFALNSSEKRSKFYLLLRNASIDSNIRFFVSLILVYLD